MNTKIAIAARLFFGGGSGIEKSGARGIGGIDVAAGSGTEPWPREEEDAEAETDADDEGFGPGGGFTDDVGSRQGDSGAGATLGVAFPGGFTLGRLPGGWVSTGGGGCDSERITSGGGGVEGGGG